MRLIQFEPLFIRHFSTITWPFPLHNHNHYELMFIRYGKGIHELNSNKSKYTGETIFFLSPEDSHDFIIREETQFNVIKFLPAVLKGGVNPSNTDYWDNLLGNLARKWAGGYQQIPMERVRPLIDLMIEEWKDNNQQVTEVHTNLLRSLLLILDNNIRGEGDHNISNYGVSTIERIQHYIHTHIHFPEKLTINHLSQTFGLSSSGLRNLFTQKMEMPLRTYISALKLEKIKERMKHSNNTISEIAQEFGFGDTSHFTKFFKQQTGINPLTYRKRNLQR